MILVTGGTGLVGAHLLYQLVKNGERPRAIYRAKKTLEKTKKVFSYYSKTWEEDFEQIEWVPSDLNDVVALEDTFKGVTEVYHSGALISFDPKDYKKLLHVNVEGTANVVNLSIAAKVKKICYVSSIAALGTAPNTNKVSETTEWDMENTYGYAISKHLGEMELWRASQEGIAIAIVNPGVILGPGFWKTGSGLLFSTAWKSPSYYLPNGTGFVTVNDVVTALLLLMQADVKNERFILVNQNWSYKKIMAVLAKGLQKKVPVKKIQFWQLEILWRLDWCYSQLTGNPRKLSKKMAGLFKKQRIYHTTKLSKFIPQFSYEDLEGYCYKCSAIFLKEK